jgi:tetratricopeptide (TPR) repeat protein
VTPSEQAASAATPKVSVAVAKALAQAFAPRAATGASAPAYRYPKPLEAPLPNDPYKRGKMLLDRGRYREALASLDQAIQEGPDGPKDLRAYRCRAFACLLAGQLEAAIRDFGTAAQIDPNDAAAYYGRGCARRFLGHTEQAIADLSEAIRIDSTYQAAYWARSRLYYDLGDFEKGSADSSRAMEISNREMDRVKRGNIGGMLVTVFHVSDHRNFEAGRRVDLSYIHVFQCWEALHEEYRDLWTAPEKRFKPADPAPADAQQRKSAAIELAVEGKFQDSLASLDQATRVAPKDWTAYRLRGLVCVVNLDRKAAVESYSKAIELKPDEIDPRIQRSRLYSDMGEYEKARSDSQEIMRLFNAPKKTPAKKTPAKKR